MDDVAALKQGHHAIWAAGDFAEIAKLSSEVGELKYVAIEGVLAGGRTA
jgi:hypothetical protein